MHISTRCRAHKESISGATARPHSTFARAGEHDPPDDPAGTAYEKHRPKEVLVGSKCALRAWFFRVSVLDWGRLAAATFPAHGVFESLFQFDNLALP